MRLRTTKAPALAPSPAIPAKGHIDIILNALRLYFVQLDAALGALLGRNGGTALQNPHAMLMSDADQPNAGVTSENIVTYNTPVIEQGIEVRNGGEIHFTEPGQYLVTFSLQFANRGNAAQVIEVWAKQDGANFPLSNTRYDIPARKSISDWSHVVAAISGIFTVTDPDTTYLRIAWWSDGADVFLEDYPASTSPTRPAIPSVILTANFVSRLP